MLHASGLTVGIFLLIGLGALARKLGLLRHEDRVGLNNVIIFISLPALIFTAARRAPFEPSLISVAVLALAISFLGLAAGYLLAKILRLTGPLLGAWLLASGVGNTGYLGYPLTRALFGSTHLVKAVFYDIFGTVVVLFTAGIYFANKYGAGSGSAWRQGFAYATPNLVGLFLGFALQGVKLPLPLDLAVNSMAQATTGIIMLSIGISLSGQLGRARRTVALIALLKLGFMPATALLLGLVFNQPPIIRDVTLLQASMPVALMTFVIGDRYRLDRDFLSGAILVSTLFSMLTIPLWQALAHNL